jgi:peptidyl-tRNA hydrolase
MESWHLSLAVVICGVIAQFAVNKYQNGEFKSNIEKLELQTQRKQYLTSEKADEIYLRIREFERVEKHIDKRFDGIEKTQLRILNILENINKGK